MFCHDVISFYCDVCQTFWPHLEIGIASAAKSSPVIERR
jgi:hypothetical protein